MMEASTPVGTGPSARRRENPDPRAARPRVLRFGGTLAGSPDGLLRIVEIIAAGDAGGQLAVVAPALGHLADPLEEAARLAAAGELESAEGGQA